MKNIKILLILFFAMVLFGITNAQSWTKNLTKSTENLTLFDYQKAFNDYWTPFNVKDAKYIGKNGEIKKAAGWKQFKRWEYFWSSRVNPITGEFPKTSASEEYNKHIAEYGAYPNDAGNWQTMGTNSSAGGYAGIGRVGTVEFHPTNDNIFWIGAPAGGLWVTEDAGITWTVLTDNNDVLGVSAIVIPSDYETSSTIYIGTGDRDANDNSSVGVLKSTNSGATWNSTGLSFLPSQGETVNAMLLEPANDNSIFAATSDGLYFTDDAAVSWTKIATYQFIDLEFKPGNTQIIYGSTRNGQVYTSNDYGLSWSLTFSASASNRIEMAVTANNPDIVYVLASNSSNGLEGIYKSEDSGTTFDLVFNSLSLLNWSTDGNGENNGQAWYDLALAADPNNADILYCGGVNTWKSEDGGVSWSLANHWYGGGGVQDVHADKHFFKYRNNTSELFECNDGGLYSTTNGNSWVDLSNGLVISQMYGHSTAQTAPDITITGLQDNGTKMRAVGVWYDVLGGDGMKCIVDYTDYNIQYGSLYYGQIHRTTDIWSNGTEISANIPGGAAGAWVTPYVLDPNDHNTIYVGYSEIWKSEDKGNTFTSIGNAGGMLKCIAVAPSNSQVIYASTGGSLNKTINGGQNWVSITTSLPTSSSINNIIIKSNNSNVAWVVFGTYNDEGVYRTDDGGATWTNISDGLPQIPINCIVENKFVSHEEQLYVGTDFGVFIKEGNADWTLFSQGLPNVVVSELDIYYNYNSPFDSRLRASTYGRGLWETDLQMSPNFTPYITTLGFTDVEINSASLTGEITNTFGFDIIESGIIFSTNPSFNDAETFTVQTNPLVTEGEYTITATDLLGSTTYYYRAYAINENGTGLGGISEFTTTCTTLNTFPYTEDFENSGQMPNCWSEEFVLGDNNNWTFTAGIGEGTFPEAHSGSYNALFRDSDLEDDKVMLIMPVMDLSSLTSARLSFWHAQISLFSYIDELKVLYKTSASSSWTEIATYSMAELEWTYKAVSLPNISEEYYIAFEGNALNGRGICIDDVTVELSNDVDDIESNNVYIFPNPSKGVFTISSSKVNISFIEITNITGQVIYHKTDFLNEIVDLSSHADGVYFMKIVKENITTTQKIIIEK